MENYYKNLDVEFGSSAETIKKAYRKLAMKWHPDKNPYDPLAENKFKIILRAYQVLSSSERVRYDVEYTKIFLKGRFHSYATDSKFEPLYENKVNPNQFYNDIHNKKYEKEPNLKKIKVKVSLDFWSAVLGEKKQYQITDPFNKNVFSVDMTFPPGIFSGEVYEKKTVLYTIEFHVEVEKDKYFFRIGLDIHSFFELPFSTAATGGTILYPYWRETILLHIPMGFQNGQSIKIDNKGISKDNQKGHLYLKGKVIIPNAISNYQKELLNQFQKIEDGKNIPSPLSNFLKNFWKKK